MSVTWRGEGPPLAPRPIGPAGWLRIAARGGLIVALLVICFPVQQTLRLIERPLHGRARPWTPWITQAVCIATCAIMGLRRAVAGRPMRGRGALVANHVSWLDIFVLNACDRVYFVAKSEVRGWAGIGWLARGTGTVFVDRRRGDAARQRATLTGRLAAGHRLLIFPEGTSTDGCRVLPFRSTVFAALFDTDLGDDIAVQPVSLAYRAPDGCDPRFYGWWGEMSFAASLLQVLAVPRNGAVRVTFHPPVRVAKAGDRKTLAQVTGRAVRAGVEAGIAPAP